MRLGRVQTSNAMGTAKCAIARLERNPRRKGVVGRRYKLASARHYERHLATFFRTFGARVGGIFPLQQPFASAIACFEKRRETQIVPSGELVAWAFRASKNRTVRGRHAAEATALRAAREGLRGDLPHSAILGFAFTRGAAPEKPTASAVVGAIELARPVPYPAPHMPMTMHELETMLEQKRHKLMHAKAFKALMAAVCEVNEGRVAARHGVADTAPFSQTR